MSETFFKTLVVIAIIIILFYLTFFSISRKNIFEGLENNVTPAPSTTTTQQSGEAANSENYAALIKAEVIRLKKDLQIKKYQKDYENAIINLEDLVNLSILKIVLNLSNDPAKDIKKMEMINTLKNSNITLNEIMKFIDKQ